MMARNKERIGMPHRILVVDDDPPQRRLLESLVESVGYAAVSAADGEEAMDILARDDDDHVDLELTYVVMPGLDGIEMMGRVKAQRPSLPFIVLTAHGGLDMVIRAMRAGATDFIVKPAAPARLKVSIENALKLNALTGEVSALTRQVSGHARSRDILGDSPAMAAVLKLVNRGALSNIPILIEGESGVGKELVARAIQGSGDRAGRPFVTVNCAAIPEKLVESVLFGHEKGAFTGAESRHIGKFQEADGGTLFLDEIGELAPEVQVKLLRALQEGEVDPVGAAKATKVDIRIVSATNRDLADLVRQGRFREDLYYRLNVFPIQVPALRERMSDLPMLACAFLTRFAASEGKQIGDISDAALDLLQGYAWPGNVRQLQNAIFRAVVLCDGEVLDVDHFPEIARALRLRGTARAPTEPPRGEFHAAEPSPEGVAVIGPDGRLRRLRDVERDVLRLSLTHHKGRMSRIARELEIGRSTLYRKVREFSLDADEDEDAA